MEWINTRWDWENHEIYSSKVVITSPAKLDPAQWEEQQQEEDIDGGSDVANNSSTKTSVSASTGSSIKGGIKVSNFSSGGFGFGVFSSKEFDGVELNESSPLMEASASSSAEPFIGLRLGKRTYFENSFGTSNSNTPSSVIISTGGGKKVKPCCLSSTLIPRCQVEGCNLDLSSAKQYHRKHRVCENHAKFPRVVVSGLERRFCQQCSRFHSLSEFDEKKRSCRRRLSDHNARRRKPQQETIHFNSTNLSSSYYGKRQQVSFVVNNAPTVVQGRPVVNSTWENSSNSTNSVTKIKTDKSGVVDGVSRSLGMQLPNAVCSMPTSSFKVEVLDQGFKESLSPNVEAIDIRRALSLLSNKSWGLYEPDLVALDQPRPLQHDNPVMVPHGMQSVPQGLPLSSPNYWQADEQQQSIDPHIHHAVPAKTSNPTNSQFQEFQLFNHFYSNPMDEF